MQSFSPFHDIEILIILPDGKALHWPRRSLWPKIWAR